PESSEEDGYQATDEEQDLVRLTMQVAQFVRETETELAAYLEQTVPLRKSGNTLFLGLEKGHLFEQQIKSPRARAAYLEAVKRALGPDALLELELDCKEATHVRTLSAFRARQRRAEQLRAIE